MSMYVLTCVRVWFRWRRWTVIIIHVLSTDMLVRASDMCGPVCAARWVGAASEFFSQRGKGHLLHFSLVGLVLVQDVTRDFTCTRVVLSRRSYIFYLYYDISANRGRILKSPASASNRLGRTSCETARKTAGTSRYFMVRPLERVMASQ